MGYDLQMLKEPKFQICSGYWRTNGQGMTRLCAVMDWAGVLDNEFEGPEVEELDADAIGLSEDEADALFECLDENYDLAEADLHPTEAQLAVMRTHLARVNAWRTARSPEESLVPVYKFDGNEGCHVLPEECALIADALDEFLKDPPEDMAESLDWEGDEEDLIEWLEDWRDYNRVAATHGGYTVS